MRTDKEIEKKILEIVNNEDNFVEVEIDYVEATSEIRFSDYETIKTLTKFSKWLLGE